MGELSEFSRRRFLGLVSAAGLPSVGHPASSSQQGGELGQKVGGAPAGDSKPGLQGLTVRQVETLGALADQIVPTDTDPGARDAGVVQYIAGVLAGNQASKLALYDAGLEGVDQTSQLVFGRDFIRLSFQEQTTVLKMIEQGQSPGEIWKTVASREFFLMLWNHVLEGFYGPPEEGGNKNYASWKMIGFPPHSGTMLNGE